MVTEPLRQSQTAVSTSTAVSEVIEAQNRRREGECRVVGAPKGFAAHAGRSSTTKIRRLRHFHLFLPKCLTERYRRSRGETAVTARTALPSGDSW